MAEQIPAKSAGELAVGSQDILRSELLRSGRNGSGVYGGRGWKSRNKPDKCVTSTQASVSSTSADDSRDRLKIPEPKMAKLREGVCQNGEECGLAEKVRSRPQRLRREPAGE